jgi:hypothetical protein
MDDNLTLIDDTKDSVMEDDYNWCDPPPTFVGGDIYGVNNTWEGTWRGSNGAGGQESADQPQIAFTIPSGARTPFAIRARIEADTGGGYPYLIVSNTIDTPEARTSRGVGRVHVQDKGAANLLNSPMFTVSQTTLQ